MFYIYRIIFKKNLVKTSENNNKILKYIVILKQGFYKKTNYQTNF